MTLGYQILSPLRPMIKFCLLKAMKSHTSIRLVSHSSLLLRRLCTASAAEVPASALESTLYSVMNAPTRNHVGVQKLFRQITSLGSRATGGGISEALDNFVNKRSEFTEQDLLNCVRRLRRARRYQQCYEMLEWMEKGNYKYSAGDYAIQLDILNRVKGIAEAEYFNSLPAAAKNHSTYGALLNCYCIEPASDKVATLFKEMEQLSLLTPLAFGSLMSMSLKLGQPEKVPPLMQEIEKRNIQAMPFTWTLLIQAHAKMNEIEGVERAFAEIEKGDKNCVWTFNSNLVDACIKSWSKPCSSWRSFLKGENTTNQLTDSSVSFMLLLVIL